MRYEVIQCKTMPGLWQVHADDHNPPHAHYSVIFNGANAESRAREYAAWKNVFAGGSKGGINGGQFRR